jgi:quercetin dioxygenase-like cupin family protein
MVRHERKVQPVDVYGGGGRILKQVLMGPRDGFSGFLREFTVAPGQATPDHSHDWHHLVYVLEGEGRVKDGQDAHSLEKGVVVYIEANRQHQFTNTGPGVLRFLCLVPPTGDSYE